MIKKLAWDKREGAFLKFIELLKNEGHIIDIGANIGVMTYHFSTKLQNTQIHSFEPIPVNFQILKKIVNKYKLSNVVLYQKALGDKNETIQMIMPKISKIHLHGLSHVVQTDSFEKGDVFTVDMSRLDDISEFLKYDIRALKIDVEEFEYQVLQGAEKIIQKNRPLIYCELWDNEIRKKCFEFLCKLNYSVFVCEYQRLVNYTGQEKIQNFFFIPVEHCEKLNLY